MGASRRGKRELQPFSLAIYHKSDSWSLTAANVLTHAGGQLQTSLASRLPSDLSLLIQQGCRRLHTRAEKLPSLASISYRFSGNLKLTFKMGIVFVCFRWERNCRTAFWTHFTEFWTCVMKVSLQKASLISGAALFHCEQWNGLCFLLVWRQTVWALWIIPI